ncbi:type IV toxin-antitoxin system AbiEi family antitoxin domain-containing protein [Leifsonia sp. L25]|uniref:type IV toxin-antitoxin system AbiEi family antitoxin domain-containing protein n=1 Tax=Actinomycetes TaxID=1760 RepID=UPI003D68C2FC
MSLIDAMRKVSDICGTQYGMTTVRQAAAAGVSRQQLARLVEAGLLERETHGVYRAIASAGDDLDWLRAVYLSIDPGVLAGERLAERERGGVVFSHAAAAAIHGIGDLRVDVVDLTAPVRRQGGSRDVRWHRRQLPSDAVQIWRGLPVTSPTVTVADLLNSYVDFSLAAQVLRDGISEIDISQLATLVRPSVARNSGTRHPVELVEKLAALAGVG